MIRSLWVSIFLVLLSTHVAPAQAQEERSCTLLCTPELEFEPTVAVEPLFGGAPVRNRRTGAVTEASPSSTFEMVFAVGIPTTIPRVGLTGEVIWSPFASTDANPFTGRSATDLGVGGIHDNPVELEAELNFALLTPNETGGWADVHFDIIDQLSPAERPGAERLYTHKLNLELDAAVLLFHELDKAGYLQHVELEGSFDYMATGLPQKGDTFGPERYLEDASPWGYSAVLVLPLAPLP